MAGLFTEMCTFINWVAVAMLYSCVDLVFVFVFSTNKLNFTPTYLPLYPAHYKLVLEF